MAKDESIGGAGGEGEGRGGMFMAASGGSFERDFAPAFEEDPEEAHLADGGVSGGNGAFGGDAGGGPIRLVEDGEGELEFHGPPPMRRYLEAEALPVAFVDGVRRAEAAVGFVGPGETSGFGRTFSGLLGVVGAGGVLRPGRGNELFIDGAPLPGLLGGGCATVPWEQVVRYALWEVATPLHLATARGLHLGGGKGPKRYAPYGEDPLHYRATRSGFRPRDEVPGDLTGAGRQLTNELNSRMQQAEGMIMLLAADEISRTLERSASGRAYVVTDGPLVKPGLSLGRDRPAGTVTLAGFAKTHAKAYLRPEQHEALSGLPPFWRTSLFTFYSSRYSFYLRLPASGGAGLFRALGAGSGGEAALAELVRREDELRRRDPFSGPMSGLVRVELPRYLGLEAASRAATDLQCLLPLFASAPYRDGRAPVNLEPVAALERHLKRLLGSAALIERLVGDVLAAEALGAEGLAVKG